VGPLDFRGRGFGAAGSGRELRRLLGCPGPGHKLVDAGRGPEIDELGEYVCEVGLRVDAVELAGLCRSPNYAERGLRGAHYFGEFQDFMRIASLIRSA
jgi:hypothetical protein